MRPGWSMGVEGLSTVVRVLPPGMYEQISGDNGHEGRMMNRPKSENPMEIPIPKPSTATPGHSTTSVRC